jgi:hypothetical protein
MTEHPVTTSARSPERGGQQPDADVGRTHGEVGRGFLGLVRLPPRRVTIWAVIVAVLVAAVCWYFGADLWHSVLLGSVLTTVGLITMVGTPDRAIANTDWRGDAGTNRVGSRGEVAELSWSLRTSYGRVDNKAVSRARQLARRRLALRQLDLNDPADRPAIEALIGRSTYAILVTRERRPLLRSLLHCLDALDALDTLSPTMPAAPPSKPRRHMPTFLRHRLRRARER